MKKIVLWIVLLICILTSCSNENISSSESTDTETDESIGQETTADTELGETIA